MNTTLLKVLDTKWKFFLFLCCTLFIFSFPNEVSAQLKVSIVKVNITPKTSKQLLGYAARKSEGVLDSIFLRILLLDDGISRFLLVASDICLISPSEYDRVASSLQKKTGISPMHFWWSATHTHSAPEVGPPGLPESFMDDRYKHEVDTVYANFVELALLIGVREAITKLESAVLSVGWGYAEANINRRTWGTDQRATFGMNPNGAVDRRIGLLKIQKPDGSLLGTVANYAIHSTALGPQNLEISGDVAGIVADYVEQKTGAPLLFINGAAGNMAPIYSVYPLPDPNLKKIYFLDQFKVLLGDRILEALDNSCEVLDRIHLETGEVMVKTSRRASLTKWPDDLKKYTEKLAEGKGDLVKLPVRFLKINPDLAIWSAPLELFCEISNNVRDQSPYLYTFYFGYTNGWLGYLPTLKAWENGGYEVHTVSPFTESAEKDITTAVMGFLRSNSFVQQSAEKKRKLKSRNR